MKMRNLYILLALAFLAACSSENSSSEEAASESQSTEAPASDASADGADVMRSGGYTLTPMSSSPSYPDATINSMTYNEKQWSFDISGDSYQLGVQTSDASTKGCANSGQGQHIHLIVDNQPYAAKYESDFEFEIADGKHAVLAFLSRSYHESIKTAAAHKAQRMYVLNNKVERTEPIESPQVFYSRPKGVYEGGDTERVMLDYYLVNTNENHYVMADINGEQFKLTTWQPYIVEGLPAGDNTITLTLMDDNGAVNSELNPVSRTFKLNP
jgi:major membrane immunogen (membrane-anchored lipoprotein)